jgi:hypothetical protein
MYKKIFFHSIAAGLLSALCGWIYSRIHFFATQADFSAVLNPLSITAYCIIISILIGFIYWLIQSVSKKNPQLIFNLAIAVINFAAVIIPISISLPLTVQFPELFPGLAVPMLFFPLIAWHTLQPLFQNKSAG